MWAAGYLPYHPTILTALTPTAPERSRCCGCLLTAHLANSALTRRRGRGRSLTRGRRSCALSGRRGRWGAGRRGRAACVSALHRSHFARRAVGRKGRACRGAASLEAATAGCEADAASREAPAASTAQHVPSEHAAATSREAPRAAEGKGLARAPLWSPGATAGCRACGGASRGAGAASASCGAAGGHSSGGCCARGAASTASTGACAGRAAPASRRARKAARLSSERSSDGSLRVEGQLRRQRARRSELLHPCWCQIDSRDVQLTQPLDGRNILAARQPVRRRSLLMPPLHILHRPRVLARLVKRSCCRSNPSAIE